MQKREFPFQISAERTFPPADAFLNGMDAWVFDSEIRQASQDTIDNRRWLAGKLRWWLAMDGATQVDSLTLRKFFAYITKSHLDAAGRWGNPRLRTPPSPETVKTYHRVLSIYCNWLVAEQPQYSNPMAQLSPPISRPDDVVPLSLDQVRQLMRSAARTSNPDRDLLILMLLLDTGMRVSELAGIRRQDIDMQARQVVVAGKGGKSRPVYYGARTARAVWKYMAIDPLPAEAQLLRSERGVNGGSALTATGIQRVLRRLGEDAGITGARVSPHTLRHTFAIEFLRSGGNQFTLMAILGHTNVRMTARYVQIAQADVARQQREKSAVDRLTRGR